MDRDDLIRVGVITTPHGVRGEVKVFPTTDDPKYFKKIKKVYLDTGKEITEHELASVKFFKNMVILSFKDITDRNAAELMRKWNILIKKEDARKPGKDEYFIFDLIGMTVVDSKDGRKVGALTDVLSTGANDVYEITYDEAFLYEGQKPKGDKFYAPAIHECIEKVDVAEGVIRMNLMKGLIDV